MRSLRVLVVGLVVGLVVVLLVVGLGIVLLRLGVRVLDAFVELDELESA